MIKIVSKWVYYYDDGQWWCGLKLGGSLWNGRTREEAKKRFLREEENEELQYRWPGRSYSRFRSL